jgi:hypothetical protein
VTTIVLADRTLASPPLESAIWREVNGLLFFEDDREPLRIFCCHLAVLEEQTIKWARLRRHLWKRARIHPDVPISFHLKRGPSEGPLFVRRGIPR